MVQRSRAETVGSVGPVFVGVAVTVAVNSTCLPYDLTHCLEVGTPEPV